MINLDLNVPAIAESFHANWTSKGHDDHETEWRLKLPLAVAGHSAGSLTIAGRRDEDGLSADTPRREGVRCLAPGRGAQQAEQPECEQLLPVHLLIS